MSLESLSRAVLAERTMGQYPLSIATSQAIESLVGILPEAPQKYIPIEEYDAVWVNMRTLLRNMLGALSTDQRPHALAETVAELLVNEMRTIESIVTEKSDGRVEVTYYKCSYTDLSYSYNKSILRSPTSKNLKDAQLFDEHVLKVIDDEYQGHIPYLTLTRNFPDIHVKALILTHYPIDLLQRYRFETLALLESHTGAVKPPTLWNTKLKDGKELERIPFDRMTLQLFGDGVTFTPMNIKVRRKLVEIADKHKWTPMSTKDFIIYSVEQNRDPALESLVKDLYRI